MKKVIFLDFDGVMVTDRHLINLTATNSLLRDKYGAIEWNTADVECPSSSW